MRKYRGLIQGRKWRIQFGSVWFYEKRNDGRGYVPSLVIAVNSLIQPASGYIWSQLRSSVLNTSGKEKPIRQQDTKSIICIFPYNVNMTELLCCFWCRCIFNIPQFSVMSILSEFIMANKAGIINTFHICGSKKFCNSWWKPIESWRISSMKHFWIFQSFAFGSPSGQNEVLQVYQLNQNPLWVLWIWFLHAITRIKQ